MKLIEIVHSDGSNEFIIFGLKATAEDRQARYERAKRENPDCLVIARDE